ncbi:amino acid adenylation domain-containing protein [Pseudoalteromonas sp. MMG013]|uniref:non-ribosomal peptide synthetase n=1 Tax=Pseudoalteromonas sp. MMG013 TaxID=2822687 RepID=UPI001B366CCC|nr:non-ribosomal peptide synthetase [Pseudoalteromonas sp. MMG013]MBQ4862228.1 amino acid adenylation domain-containing protein [Pseudoalteromonas sp. MMG013]
MNLEALLDYCDVHGITLSIEQEQLKVEAEEAQYTEQFISTLRTHKQALLSHLREQETALERAPITMLQQRIWLLEELTELGSAYKQTKGYRFDNAISISVLQQALATTVKQHPILSLAFERKNARIEQFITHQCPDIDSLICSTPDELEQVVCSYLSQPVELQNDTPMRVGLVSMNTGESILLLSIHHIICDGISLSLVLRALLKNYLAIEQGAHLSIASESHFLQFARDESAQFMTEQLEHSKQHWKKRLSELPQLHELHTHSPRVPDAHNIGAVVSVRIKAPLHAQINAFCQSNACSVFNLMQAVFAVVIGRYSNSDDIVFGVPVSLRHQGDYQESVGLFLNTLVVRNQIDESLSLQQWVAQCKERFLLDSQHHVSLELLLEELNIGRNRTYNPLFQIMLTVQQAQQQLIPSQLGGMQELELAQQQKAKLDLTLNVLTGQNDSDMRWEYNTSLFCDKQIEAIAHSMLQLLDAATCHSTKPLASLSHLSDAQTQNLKLWNDTSHQWQKNTACIHHTIEYQAAQTAHNIALKMSDSAISYQELNVSANKLARYMSHQQQMVGQFVAVFMDRSIDLVISLFSCLKAGAAYIPLDPSYPLSRIDYMLTHSQPSKVLCSRKTIDMLPEQFKTKAVVVDELLSSVLFDKYSGDNLADCQVDSSSLAYMIYTSGSTGQPKGVMVEHRGPVNLFNHLDRLVSRTSNEQETWLAATSTSFDISVLELFWSLSRGAKVVIQPERIKKVMAPVGDKEITFSLSFFSSNAEVANPYQLLFASTEFADKHGFEAVWLPERHFHQFGGGFPNPAVVGAAVAGRTEHLQIRAGSVVLPLHDPIRVAEEWAVLDNISNGRVGMSIAPGWHPNDFVLVPSNYEDRRTANNTALEQIRQLWRGEPLERENGLGQTVSVNIYPKLQQAEMPIWLTVAKSKDAFAYAGEHGFHVLTHLLGQSFEELAEKVTIYRQAREKAGLDSNAGKVTLMVHTFVNDDQALIAQQVAPAFREYLRTSVDLLKSVTQSSGLDLDNPEHLEQILDAAFKRYFGEYSLIGSIEDSLNTLARIHQAGIDELACLIDFGVDESTVVDGLENICQLQRHFKRMQAQQKYLSSNALAVSVSELIDTHGVTHLQMTPSHIKELLKEQRSRQALSNITCCLVGGEAIPEQVSQALKAIIPEGCFNVYGPTETSIWSAIKPIAADNKIGGPIANTQFFILTSHMQPNYIYAPGELYISGDGLARGYYKDIEKTNLAFKDISLHGEVQRVYRTGDLASWNPDGTLNYLGRNDTQTKVRGFRVELEEIEAKLIACSEVIDAAVAVQHDAQQQAFLAAYIVTHHADHTELQEILKSKLSRQLADFMVPTAYMVLDTLPLTPNGKLARNLLPHISLEHNQAPYRAPRNDIERKLADIWAELFALDRVSLDDNFFALGGHSLLATRVQQRVESDLDVSLSLRQLFETETLEQLAKLVTSAHTKVDERIIRHPENEIGALSFGQQRIWFIEQLYANNSHYNEFIVLTLEGELVHQALQWSLSEVIERHHILRTVYKNDAHGSGTQVVLDEFEFNVPIHVLDESKDLQQQINTLIHREANRHFDLSKDVLLRAQLIALPNDHYVFLLCTHHIASDGWSRSVLLKDFSDFYQYALYGKAKPEPLEIQFADYALWQSSDTQQQLLNSQLDYWLEQLQGLPTVHQFPLDHTRPKQQSFAGAKLSQQLSLELSDNVFSIAREFQTSPFVIMQSALALLIATYSQQEEVVMGTVVANRQSEQLTALIGNFVNNLVLRTFVSPNDTFAEFVEQCKGVHAGAMDNQSLPFELLVEKLNPTRSQQHHALFQIAFIYHNYQHESFDIPDLKIGSYEHDEVFSKFDIQLSAFDKDGCIHLTWEYNTDLFYADTMQQVADNFASLISALRQSAQLQMGQLEILSNAQTTYLKALGLGEFESTQGSQLVHQQFEHYAAEHSDAPAVFFAQQQLTYGQLNARANQVANYLITQCGVKPDTLVGLCVERSIDMVVGMLGILKAGGAYVPLDPSYPKERLAFMLQDSQISHVLVSSEVNAKEIVTTHHTICVDDISQTYPSDRPQVNELTTNNLAYVLYTSGSTGKPKGVMVEHSSVCNFIDSMKQSFPIGPSDRVLGLTSMNFDIHVLELYLSLSTGSALVLANEEQQRAPEQLATLLLKHEVSLMQATPSSWKMLLDAGWQSSQVLTMLSGGEALPQELLKRLYAHCPAGRVFNMYGPTESTVWSSMGELKAGECHLGRPIANTQLLVLDSQQRLLPQGAIGELYISGAGLARGYLGQRELTQSRFVANPYYEPGKSWSSARLYKTGDLVRYNLQGQLEFKGRSDEQVKIHGHRIELAEIETQLAALEAVSSAVVIAAQVHGNNQLVGYVQPAEPAVVGDESVYVAQLKAQLSRVLPNYMVPNILLLQQQWPKTPNGKIDKKALPTPNVGGSQSQYVAPESDSEVRLVSILASLLMIDESKVSVTASFFALGGHSLLAIKLITAVNSAFDVELKLEQIFTLGNGRAIAKHIDGLQHQEGLQLADNYELNDEEVEFNI